MRKHQFDEGINRTELDQLLKKEIYGKYEQSSNVVCILAKLLTVNDREHLDASFTFFGGIWSNLNWRRKFQLRRAKIMGAKDDIITLTSEISLSRMDHNEKWTEKDEMECREGVEMLFGMKFNDVLKVKAVIVCVCDTNTPIDEFLQSKDELFIFAAENEQNNSDDDSDDSSIPF